MQAILNIKNLKCIFRALNEENAPFRRIRETSNKKIVGLIKKEITLPDKMRARRDLHYRQLKRADDTISKLCAGQANKTQK